MFTNKAYAIAVSLTPIPYSNFKKRKTKVVVHWLLFFLCSLNFDSFFEIVHEYFFID